MSRELTLLSHALQMMVLKLNDLLIGNIRLIKIGIKYILARLS